MPTEGLEEAFNKIMCTLLEHGGQKQKELLCKLPEAIWAYRTVIRTLTQTTPYSGEAILLIKIQLLSLRVAVEEMTKK